MRRILITLVFVTGIPFITNCESLSQHKDTIRSGWSMTYQPVLYIAPDALALLYISFNAEFHRTPDKPAVDIQIAYVYANTKTESYRYFFNEKQNVVFIDIGQRYYFGKKRKAIEHKTNRDTKAEIKGLLKTGFYVKPAISVALNYTQSEELNYNLNQRKSIDKVEIFPALGFFLGYKRVNEDKFVLNIHFGVQLSYQPNTNQLIISPLISGGFGIYF